jgi:ADP-ribose pyrophosphatase YjhB (NUDIX family)
MERSGNMSDNYSFSVGCIVKKGSEVLLVRHTYGGAKGKLLIPGGFCHENELPEEAAVREVFEETAIMAEVKRMAGIRCDRETWYMLFVMDYVDGTATSDGEENSEALFCEISEVLGRSDCTEMTKVALRKILDEKADYFISDVEYKKHKGENYTLYI